MVQLCEDMIPTDVDMHPSHEGHSVVDGLWSGMNDVLVVLNSAF